MSPQVGGIVDVCDAPSECRHEGFPPPLDWKIDCGNVPAARYAGDLWSCLNDETRRFLAGLTLCPPAPGFLGYIRLLDWARGDNKLDVSDFESLAHEIGHALDFFGGSQEYMSRRGINLLTPTPVAEDTERAAEAFFEAADAYQDWMQCRRVGDQLTLAEVSAHLKDDAKLCLQRYFRPEEQHELYNRCSPLRLICSSARA